MKTSKLYARVTITNKTCLIKQLFCSNCDIVIGGIDVSSMIKPINNRLLPSELTLYELVSITNFLQGYTDCDVINYDINDFI